MKKWRALGTGLTWAFAWSFVGTTFMGLLGVDLRATVDMIGPYAVMGLIGGGAFSVGSRRFDEMSLPRFAAWGAVAGLLLSMPSWSNLGGGSLVNVVMVGVVALMCGGCAAGSLALARKCTRRSFA